MTVREMVNEALERGGLEATAAGQRSLTVAGVALPPIRWQAAVFSLLYGTGDHGLPPRAAHLADEIESAITAVRGAR